MRAQVLRDLGIPQWVLRSRLRPVFAAQSPWKEAPSTSSRAASTRPTRRASPDPATQSARINPRLREPIEPVAEASAAAAGTSGEKAKPVTPPPPDVPAPAAQTSLPGIGAAVLRCYWLGAVVAIVTQAPNRSTSRLLKDLLAAASGDWSGKIQQVAFDAADLAGSEAANDVARAQEAFVRKRLQVAQASTLLLIAGGDDTVDGALEALARTLVVEPAIRVLSVPALAQLAQGAPLKQSLWQRMQET